MLKIELLSSIAWTTEFMRKKNNRILSIMKFQVKPLK